MPADGRWQMEYCKMQMENADDKMWMTKCGWKNVD